MVENDHIAFRTFDDKRVNIEVLSKIFLEAGYSEKGSYHFKEKKLFAKHFELKNHPEAPKVFISELMTGEFSEFLQQTVKQAIDSIPQSLLQSDELIFSGTAWEKPSFEVYKKLRDESEYAAWLYVYGFRANHFTVLSNSLKKYNKLEDLNNFLKINGFPMNTSGGEIKGSPDQLLEQSSILADIIEVDFIEGKKEIPACYYEFARRYNMPDGNLYNGFIAASADKIFESTDYYAK